MSSRTFGLRELAFAVLVLVLSALPSHAFRMVQVGTSSGVACNDPAGFAHWTTSVIPWSLDPTGIGAGQAPALEAALAAWRNVPGAYHYPFFAGAHGFDFPWTQYVRFVSDGGCTGNCLAVTILFAGAVGTEQRIDGANIHLNPLAAWSNNGTGIDVQAVLTHELGHSLGIADTDVIGLTPPTMTGSYIGTAGRTLETDDLAALQCAQSRYPLSPGPAAPYSLYVYPAACFGLVDLTWSNSPSATRYELQQSSSSSYSTAFTLYAGPDTSFSTDGFGTRYFRVRACNLDGCGPWRNGNRSAPYYPTCN